LIPTGWTQRGVTGTEPKKQVVEEQSESKLS